MRFVFFYHSLISDWNHGNAHFLRGIVSELLARGHEARVYEPEDGWSMRNLKREQGIGAVLGFYRFFPHLRSIPYRLETLDVDQALDSADVVIVHEWNDRALVGEIGAHRRKGASFRALFHDTHHRSVTDEESIAAYNLSGYDGVLAFGAVIRDRYLEKGWARRAWIWHEAADTRVFHPLPENEKRGDVVWIGNWGDGERTAEYREFLVEPVKILGLSAAAHGVRYPGTAVEMLAEAGIVHGGWLPNYAVPPVFAKYRITLHIPRRPYTARLPGIPTIRPFEALACGIPLVCAPWEDSEHLFTPGKDFLVAKNGAEMQRHLRFLLNEPAAAREMSAHGLRTIRSRHTCAHRVDELLVICRELGLPAGKGYRSPEPE